MLPPNDHNNRKPSMHRRIVAIAVASALAAGAALATVTWALGGEEPPPADGPELPEPDPSEPDAAPAADPDGDQGQRLAWAGEEMRFDFEALAATFKTGDRDGWTSTFATDASSGGPELEAQASRYFDNLTALGAAPLSWRLISGPSEMGEETARSYESTIGLSFCLAPADATACTPTEVDYLAAWEVLDDGTLAISELTPGDSPYRPHPWEDVDLEVVRGERALAAAETGSGHDLDAYLEAAEDAAANADDFALTPIPSYPLFIADDAQMDSWYGGAGHAQSRAFAAPTPAAPEAGVSDTIAALHLVVGADRVGSAGEASGTIRHEAVHAATLIGGQISGLASSDTWWVMEGLAEYGSYGADLPSHRAGDTAALVAADGCRGGVDQPDAGDSLADVSGAYGCAQLGVAHLVDAYGLEATLAWFDTAHNHRGSNIDAAQEHFGQPWPGVLGEVTEAIVDGV